MPALRVQIPYYCYRSPRKVVIDDFIPCDRRGNPLFSQPKDNALWVLLLEKALAKSPLGEERPLEERLSAVACAVKTHIGRVQIFKNVSRRSPMLTADPFLCKIGVNFGKIQLTIRRKLTYM